MERFLEKVEGKPQTEKRGHRSLAMSVKYKMVRSELLQDGFEQTSYSKEEGEPQVMVTSAKENEEGSIFSSEDRQTVIMQIANQLQLQPVHRPPLIQQKPPKPPGNVVA